MSKVIKSPVERWPGEVVLSDPLTFPQVFELRDALDATEALENPSFERTNFTLLPAALKCVERWNLQGFPENPTPTDFPASPKKARTDSATLIAWLIVEVGQLMTDAENVPNA